MKEIRTECDVEEMLIDAIVECDNPVLEDVEITTFEDFGLITCDRGIVITLYNGGKGVSDYSRIWCRWCKNGLGRNWK